MCLYLREESKKPYNKKKIRWKVVYKNVDDDGKITYDATFEHFEYKQKGWNKAELNGNYDEQGFHVFVNRKDARSLAYGEENWIIKRIEVKGFLRSGTWEDDEKSETWKQFRFI